MSVLSIDSDDPTKLMSLHELTKLLDKEDGPFGPTINRVKPVQSVFDKTTEYLKGVNAAMPISPQRSIPPSSPQRGGKRDMACGTDVVMVDKASGRDIDLSVVPYQGDIVRRTLKKWVARRRMYGGKAPKSKPPPAPQAEVKKKKKKKRRRTRYHCLHCYDGDGTVKVYKCKHLVCDGCVKGKEYRMSCVHPLCQAVCYQEFNVSLGDPSTEVQVVDEPSSSDTTDSDTDADDDMPLVKRRKVVVHTNGGELPVSYYVRNAQDATVNSRRRVQCCYTWIKLPSKIIGAGSLKALLNQDPKANKYILQPLNGNWIDKTAVLVIYTDGSEESMMISDAWQLDVWKVQELLHAKHHTRQQDVPVCQRKTCRPCQKVKKLMDQLNKHNN
jgi:hypothetical protein